MTRVRTSIRVFAHHGRVLAVAALTALALSGCGSEKPSASGSQGRPDRSADPTTSATSSSPEQAAFAAMLHKVAQPCSSTDGAASPTDENPSGPTDKRPTGSDREQSLAPGQTPPTEPIEPGAPTEPELNDRDQCASVQHEQRIIQALQAVPEPTPAKVRKALNSLGYIDERIHDLKQEGEATRFYLDLRQSGGRLCEAGLAAGAETDVTVCTAPATGAFAVDKKTEEQP